MLSKNNWHTCRMITYSSKIETSDYNQRQLISIGRWAISKLNSGRVRQWQ